ncbi:MAG: hypothetical protein WCG92_20740, partial [Hyphomicrobiales bacterium]
HLDESLRAEHAGRQRRVGIVLVMNRRRGAGKIEDKLGVNRKLFTHVSDFKMEMRVAPGRVEIDEITGHQIIEPDDFEAGWFGQHGSLGKAHALFGSQLKPLLAELNETLAA